MSQACDKSMNGETVSKCKKCLAEQGILAVPVRFELTMGFPTPVFKTGAFNRSATDPEGAHDSTVTRSAIEPNQSGIIETSAMLR